MKKRYYITLSNKKIQVPYKIQNSKLTNYTIIDQMFPDERGVPEPYWDVATKIMLAIKEGKPQQWEDAGFELQKVIQITGDSKLNLWVNHFFDVCNRLENKTIRKNKSKIEIDIPDKELDFIVPFDLNLNSPIRLTKRYKLEKGII
jgi:hypothetical protein